MYSDFLTFLQALPLESLKGTSILSDSIYTEYLTKFQTFLTNLDTIYKIIATLISLIIAVAGCFFGYKLSRLFMSITGLILGLIVGFFMNSYFIHVSGISAVAVVLVSGIIFTLAAYSIYKAGIFMLCFMFAFITAAALLPFTGDVQFFVSTVFGFAIGSLAVKYIRPVIILTSAIAFGCSIPQLTLSMLHYLDINKLDSYIVGNRLYICIAGVCLLGIIIQHFTTREKSAKKKASTGESK